MGIYPLAAHMFIFYLGMMSFLTPPVAMSSYTAAGLAGSDLWTTSMDAIRTGVSGYLLPFIFVLNPALIMHGSLTEILYATGTVLVSGAYLSWAAEGAMGALPLTGSERIAALLLAISIGTSTIWLGGASPLNIVTILLGIVIIIAFPRLAAARKRAAA
jgi:TRAP-type uncharacterized transport system fused permease subunit